MAEYKYGIIGCGNMGGAMLSAFVKAVPAETVLISNRTASKSEAWAAKTGCTVADNAAIAAGCRLIFLGVKPNMLEDVLREIEPVLKARTDRFTLISMAAGITLDTLDEWLPGTSWIRIMPNLPCSVGRGMTLYSVMNTDEEDLRLFTGLMRFSGELMPIDEHKIDAASAVSGCGPAFAAMFIEALADGGVYCGLKRDEALVLAEQTALGTAELLLREKTHPDALKDAVCSPGGTTIAGVLALEEGAFRSAASEAVIAAYERTLELKK